MTMTDWLTMYGYLVATNAPHEVILLHEKAMPPLPRRRRLHVLLLTEAEVRYLTKMPKLNDANAQAKALAEDLWARKTPDYSDNVEARA